MLVSHGNSECCNLSTLLELLDAIRHGSALTWKHFNLHGEFDFSDERMVDSVGLAIPKKPGGWQG